MSTVVTVVIREYDGRPVARGEIPAEYLRMAADGQTVFIRCDREDDDNRVIPMRVEFNCQ